MSGFLCIQVGYHSKMVMWLSSNIGYDCGHCPNGWLRTRPHDNSRLIWNNEFGKSRLNICVNAYAAGQHNSSAPEVNCLQLLCLMSAAARGKLITFLPRKSAVSSQAAANKNIIECAPLKMSTKFCGTQYSYCWKCPSQFNVERQCLNSCLW